MRNRRIRVKAIRQTWTLQRILDEAAIDEEANHQTTEMEKKISNEEKEIKRIGELANSKPCGRCGRTHMQKCPAFSALRTACGKRNHYASVCRNKPHSANPQRRKSPHQQYDKFRHQKDPQTRRNHRGQTSHRRPSNRHGKVRQVLRNEEIDGKSDSSDTSTDECFIHHLQIHKASQGIQKTCTILINSIETTIEPDTGADTSIMDEFQFRKLQTQRP